MSHDIIYIVYGTERMRCLKTEFDTSMFFKEHFAINGDNSNTILVH